MIVRELRKPSPEIFKNFDYFNDYSDTARWLQVEINILQNHVNGSILDNGKHSGYCECCQHEEELAQLVKSFDRLQRGNEFFWLIHNTKKYGIDELVKMDILKVRRMAEHAHSLKLQMYNGLPYVLGHLDKVAKFYLTFIGKDPIIVSAIYGHDLIEDTDETYESIQKRFGTIFADIIQNVTDGEGKTREERQLKTYLRTRLDKNALFVKLSDRGSNMSLSKGTKHLITYINEYPRFRGALYNGDLAFEKAWRVLDLIVADLKDHLADHPEIYIPLMNK